MGYILNWGFGIPEYSLEEKFEEYYRTGLLLIISGIVAVIFSIVILVWYFKKKNEVTNANTNNTLVHFANIK